MSNFLELDDQNETNAPLDLKAMVNRVPLSVAPTRLDPQVSDGLAAQRGFSSRENPATVRTVGGKRQARGVPVEETRQLSIRMPLSLYNDFLAYADAKKLTYNEAVRSLLDRG